MSVIFDICSDLHIDSFYDKKTGGILSANFPKLKNPGSEVLVIAGDSANHYKKTFELLKRAKDSYAHVVWCDGNHEHYSSKRPVSLGMKHMREFSKRHEGITYLDGPGELRLGDTVFTGCNGWYDWEALCPDFTREQQVAQWAKDSNDKFINADIPIGRMAAASARALQAKVRQLDGDGTVGHIVVVTHTAPLRKLLDERPWDLDWQKLSGSYVNSRMADVLESHSKIRVWVYGHTHGRKMTSRYGVTFVNNSRGYGYVQGEREWFMVQMDSAG